MVNGMMPRRDEDGSSGGTSGEEDEEYMENACGSYNAHVPCLDQTPWPYLTPLNFTPQVSLAPLQSHEVEEYTKLYEKILSTVIKWRHKGHKVAIEGSWDNWTKRENLQGSNGDLMITKVLPVGVYHYLFFVDGHRRFAPDLPQESDDKGDVFNVLDLQKYDLEKEYNTPESPLSSYNNEYFSLKDLEKNVPELPPFLQSAPLQSSDDPQFEEKLLPCVLNHLFTHQLPTTALSSTQRFREKYVTVVLYKSPENL